MITVINGKRDGFIGKDKIYIGRKNKSYNLNQSPLHNPFDQSYGDKESRLRKYDRRQKC